MKAQAEKEGLDRIFRDSGFEWRDAGCSMILSMAMMFRYTFERADYAGRIEKAVRSALASGLRTGDIAAKNTKTATTAEMGRAVVKAL